MTEWWRAHRPDARRLVQLYAALLYNANLKGFVEGRIFVGDSKALCVPGINCYSCPGAVGACPLGALQNALNASGHTAPWYVLGILCLYGVMLGRAVCGWLCPLGLIQELIHKIPTPKIRKGRVTRALTHLKYAILSVFVVALPVWYGVQGGKPLPAFCKYICPAGTLEGGVGLLSNPRNATSLNQLGALFTGKFVILVAVGLACVFCHRAFCRFLCPLGAIYGLFNRFAVTGVRVNAERCVGCGRCVRDCPMDALRVGDRECVACGKCVDVCAQGAISLKCGKLTLKGPATGGHADPEMIIRRRRAGRVLWAVAIAALAALLIWVNDFGAPADDAPVGAAVGDRLADFTTDTVDGGTFHLADCRGKAVFINLWATYCAPCVEELPYFEQLKAAHPDDLEILAIHHKAGAKKAAAFLADKGWDHLAFCVDSDEKKLFELVNGTEAMPQTIVLNTRGEVIYNVQAPVTFEQLEALYRQALS